MSRKPRKVQFIRQLGTTDCGPACLTMLFRYYGYKVSIVDVKASIHIGRDGLSLSRMKEIAEEHGFLFHAFRDYYNENNLDTNLPVILCKKTNHYVVISKKTRQGYVMLDPIEGKKILGFDELRAICHNVLIRLSPQRESKHPIKKIKFNIQVNKKEFILALFLTLLTQALILVPPLMIQRIVDQIESDLQDSNMLIILTMTCLLGPVYFICNWSKKRAVLLLQNEIYKKTIKRMIDKLFRIDVSFFENHSAGDLIRRFNSTSDIYEFFSGILILTIIELLTALFCGMVMISQSMVLFFFIAFVTGMQLVITYALNKRLKQKIQNYYADKSQLDGTLVEVLNNISQIRSMHYDNIIGSKLQQKYADSILLLKQRIQLSDVMESFLMAINIVIPVFTYIIGSYLIQLDIIRMGTLIAFVTLSVYFTTPFKTISIVLPQISNLKETILRLKEFLNYKSEMLSGDIPIERFERIELKNVSYAYTDQGKKNLEHINLTIGKGEKIAIVGASGSGKTTITKLLLNVVSRYSGEVLLNGMDIRQIDQKSIATLFGAVTQTPIAINNTIRHNVDMFGNLSDEEIYELLELVELKEEVLGYPMQLSTLIGENGQNISGGQKQRIAIARALATRPEIIILDEATSNLDPVTEKRIFDKLKQTELTLVMVTHRLHAIQDADKIYVISDGRIIEHGNHSELLAHRGDYNNMLHTFEYGILHT